MQKPYQEKPYYYSREGVGFHFLAPPPEDIRSPKYLNGDDPENAICSVLAHAQNGNFAPCWRLIELMQLHDDWLVWYDCGRLLAYTAPRSLLQELLATFSDQVTRQAHTAKWIGWILGQSGSLWAAPEILRLFYLHPPGRSLSEKTREWWLPDYLSFLLEKEGQVIADGPGLILLLRDPEWPEWVDSESFYDDEGYRQDVMKRYDAVRSRVSDPEHNCVCEGEILSLRRIAQGLLERLPKLQHLLTQDEMWLEILEAYTGIDMTSNHKHPHLAVKQVEQFLASPTIEEYEPGVRYFFGYRIPD